MKLTYIYHSCFAIETALCNIVIDYYRDTKDAENGYIHDFLLKSDKKLYVLSSHSHYDHFYAQVLEWKDDKSDIQYIFSTDILEAHLAQQSDAHYLQKLDEYTDKHLRVKAFGSTDLGISFLIECEGKTIFHAGDLNNWHWNQESTPEEARLAESQYIKELSLLSQGVKQLDLAMFPIDQRLGKDYMLGAEQFVDAIKVDMFAPMHFDEEYAKANAFRQYVEGRGGAFFEIKERGDSIEF